MTGSTCAPPLLAKCAARAPTKLVNWPGPIYHVRRGCAWVEHIFKKTSREMEKAAVARVALLGWSLLLNQIISPHRRRPPHPFIFPMSAIKIIASHAAVAKIRSDDLKRTHASEIDIMGE